MNSRILQSSSFPFFPICLLLLWLPCRFLLIFLTMNYWNIPELSPQTLPFYPYTHYFYSFIFYMISEIIFLLTTPEWISPSQTSFLKIFPLRYLLGTSYFAIPKSHTYPSHQTCSLQSLLCVSNCTSTLPFAQAQISGVSFSFFHNLLSIHHKVLLSLPRKYTYNVDILHSLYFYQFSPSHHHF